MSELNLGVLGIKQTAASDLRHQNEIGINTVQVSVEPRSNNVSLMSPI